MNVPCMLSPASCPICVVIIMVQMLMSHQTLGKADDWKWGRESGKE